MANDKIVTRRGIYLYINGQEVSNDVKSIRAEMSKLVNQQAKMTIGSEEYIRAGRKIQALNGILSEHRNQWMKTNSEIDKSKNSMFSLSKAADGFNKYFGMATAAIASLTGISFAMRKSVDDYADMDEAMANVRKYTNMTIEEVKELNEEFKKMDTRTPRIQLNELAAEAGKLGITGKQNLIDFVEAANTIKVALGEDLGEEAILNIGKLSKMFGEVEKSGIKNAMLAVGSAVNQVGQSSMASEKYLVEFTARMAGTANQAGLSISEILGYASVLDQNMIQQEMAATALQTVMLGMYQKPAQFAKLAGIELQKFTKLVEEDANEAFLTLLQTMSNKGGLQQLAPVFKELGVDGTRAISVLNSLVSNVGKLRSEQENAAQAYKEATSVTNEYNVQNNTVKATIDKAINSFKEYSIMLGEKLAPYMGAVISKGGMMVKTLTSLTEIIIKHGATIFKVTLILAAYVAGKKLAVLWTERENAVTAISVAVQTTYKLVVASLAIVYNLLRGNIFAAQVAMVAFNTALKASGIGLLISALATAGVLLYNFISKQRESSKYTRQMNQAILEETSSVNKLFDALKIAATGTDQRRRLIQAINEKYGEYLPKLLEETASLNDIREAQDRVNASIRKNIALKTQSEAVDNIEKESLEDKASQLDDVREKLLKKLPASEVELALQRIVEQTDRAASKGYSVRQALSGVFSNLKNDFFGNDAGKMDKQTANALEDYIDVVFDTAEKISKEKAKYSPFLTLATPTELPEVVVTAKKKTNSDSSEGTAAATTSEEEQKKAYDKALNNLEEAYKKQNTLIKQEYIARKKTQEEMQNELLQSEMNYLYAKKIIQEKFGKSFVDTEGQLADKIIEAATKRQKEQEELDKVLKTKSAEDPEENPVWETLAKGTEIQLAVNESLYKAGLISHQEYLRRKGELDDKAREEKEEKDKESADKEMALKETVLGAVSSLSNSAVSIIKAAQSKEEKALDEKYKYKLILAEGDNEATALLEEQKEAELLAIKKKYADKAFAFQVLAITAETAVAAMRAYSAALELGLPGIPLAPIMAGVAIAAGAAQIVVANQQREQAAQMWDGGYTGAGGKYEPRKLIQTHGGEFVANKNTVQLLRPMFDVIDYAQKTGNVAALTGPEMTAAVSGNVYRSPAVYQAPAAQASQDASSTPDILRALAENTRIMARLNARLNDPIKAEVSITGENGVKKQQDSYDQLIKNATR